jgi:hypothetical protein
MDARSSPAEFGGRAIVAPVLLVLVVLAPLSLLGTAYVTHDANAIWIFHASWILAGHRAYQASLANPAYAFSNPSYPPLASSAVALSGLFVSPISAPDGAAVIALLNACALYVVGLGIVEIAPSRSRSTRGLALLFAMGIALLGFAFDGSYSVAGDADLLWAATGVAAILYGLILPSRPDSCRVAIVCAVVASFTKSEGLVAGGLILTLMGIQRTAPGLCRALPARRLWSLSRLRSGTSTRLVIKRLAPMAGLVVALGLSSGLLWFASTHFLGVGNRFFEGSGNHESTLFRLTVISRHLEPYLPVVALAAYVELVGSLRWRRERHLLGIGSAWYPWVAAGGYFAALVLTYMVGALSIRGWLDNSLGRTMVFVELCLFGQMAVWCIVGADTVAERWRARESRSVVCAAPVTGGADE